MIKYFNIFIMCYSFSCTQVDNNYESENIRIVNQFYENGHNSGNPDIADKIIASNFVKYNNGRMSKGKGPQVLKDAINMHINNNSEFRFNIDEIICEEDKVVVSWRWEATNTKFGKPVDVTRMAGS